MAGLGIESDTPPNSLQPQLVDAIHLRWATKREVGHVDARPVIGGGAMC
jgi:hypothetical protein